MPRASTLSIALLALVASGCGSQVIPTTSPDASTTDVTATDVVDDLARDVEVVDAPLDGGADDVPVDDASDVDVTADEGTADARDASSDLDDVVDAAPTDAGDDATQRDAGPDAPSDACGASAPLVDELLAWTLAANRRACAYGAGARVSETLGVTREVRERVPIDHVVILMQENRSFDHYFGTMRGDVDGIPDGYSNPDLAGVATRPSPLNTTCAAPEPPHQWEAMHTGWNGGRMDGFIRAGAVNSTPASVVLGYYTERDLPFYHWLYRTFAMSDRFFGSVLSGTWANRNFLYTGSSYGVRDTDERTIPTAPTIFDALDRAGVAWTVYTDGPVRQDCLGWTLSHRGVRPSADFFTALRAGTLAPVVFLDAADAVDEHPVSDVQRGEGWMRQILLDAMASPLWTRLAILLNYDESGGYFDHVPPPEACSPDPGGTGGYDATDLDRLGLRVPFVLVSPWARPGYVSHEPHDHTSMLRFVEALFDIPALTARDANASALLDLFDFSCPRLLRIDGAIPASGVGGCH